MWSYIMEHHLGMREWRDMRLVCKLFYHLSRQHVSKWIRIMRKARFPCVTWKTPDGNFRRLRINKKKALDTQYFEWCARAKLRQMPLAIQYYQDHIDHLTENINTCLANQEKTREDILRVIDNEARIKRIMEVYKARNEKYDWDYSTFVIKRSNRYE